MQLTKKQEKARKALEKLRASNRRWTWEEISAATGLQKGSLCGIHKGYRTFSEKTADKIIAGARLMK